MRYATIGAILLSFGFCHATAQERYRYEPDSPLAITQGKWMGYIALHELEPEFREIANFGYGRGTLSGKGISKWSTGATLATLPKDQDGQSRFILSMAFSRDGLDAAHIRIGAIGHDGKRLPPMKWFAVSGAGTEHRVVTYICSFDYSHGDIDKLVIESRAVREEHETDEQ